jgi:hypothetical protein
MNYEVFDYFGRSVYPTTGGGGIHNLTVNSGDIVLLSLNFTLDGNNVLMTAYDWNLHTSAQESYAAVGSYFVGTPNNVAQNGFFTGLMTEQYYSSPQRTSGQPVTFTDNEFNYSSAWLWIDEFNTYTNQEVFISQTNSPVDLTSTTSTWPAYLSSNGTATAANSHSFITGLQPLHSVIVHASSTATVSPGSMATINLALNNSNQGTGRLTNVTIVTDFGTYTVSGTIDANPGTTNHQVTITVPTTVTNGSHTVTVRGLWESYDAQLNAYIGQGPVQTTTVLPVAGTIPTPNPFGNTQNSTSGILSRFLPAILAVLAAIIIVPLVFVSINRRNSGVVLGAQSFSVQYAPACSRCGQFVSSNMTYCPNCGLALHGTIQSDFR